MKRLPTRWLPRAAATTRIAAHVGRAAVRRAVRTREADEAAFGEALLRELDQLKGMAMKVGQILSYMDVGLPESTVQRLSALQEGAEALPIEAIYPLIERELGEPVEALFERFDPMPVAAASIGQVHRARAQGLEVAVKVRYPGVRETIESDMSQLSGIARLASLFSSVDGQAVVAELRQYMAQECDYEAEARAQDAFGLAFRDDPEVLVPATVPSLCAEAVLTTEWCEGTRLEDARSWPVADRGATGQQLAYFTYTSLLRDGRLQADPHPGNFLLRRGGPIVALDFGCVRVFEPEVVEAWAALARCVVEGHRAGFLDALVATGQVPRPDRYNVEAGWDQHRWMFAPYLHPTFRFDRAWWQAGQHFTQPTAPNQRHVDLPPPWLWLMRMQWGLHAVLVRLGAEGEFRAVLLKGLAH